MGNQLLILNTRQPEIRGSFTSDSVYVLCDSSLGAFTVEMPFAALANLKSITVKNTGSYLVTLTFDNSSQLYYYDTNTTSIELPSGSSIELINDRTTNKWRIINDDYDRFGGQSNYSEFEDDGTLVFNGDATVWEDLNFDPDRSGGPTATRPDDVTINNVFHKEFTSANNQLCGATQEVYHETMLNKILYPHCHVFLKSGESSGTTGVTFTLYWELRQSTGTTSGSVPVSATSAQLAANANKVDLYDNTGFTGPTELGAQLAMVCARTGGNAGDVIVTSYGIHYEIDMAGSRSITTK